MTPSIVVSTLLKLVDTSLFETAALVVVYSLRGTIESFFLYCWTGGGPLLSAFIVQLVASVLTERRLERLAVPSSANALQLSEYINWLAKLQPVTPDIAEALGNFTEKTPARVARRALTAGNGDGAAPKAGKGAGKEERKEVVDGVVSRSNLVPV